GRQTGVPGSGTGPGAAFAERGGEPEHPGRGQQQRDLQGGPACSDRNQAPGGPDPAEGGFHQQQQQSPGPRESAGGAESGARREYGTAAVQHQRPSLSAETEVPVPAE